MAVLGSSSGETPFPVVDVVGERGDLASAAAAGEGCCSSSTEAVRRRCR